MLGYIPFLPQLQLLEDQSSPRFGNRAGQGGVRIETKELVSNFLLTGSRLNQPANVIRHISNLGNDDVI